MSDRESTGAGEPQEAASGFTVQGEELLAKVKQLIHEGNVRRIVIDNEQGDTILEIPVTVGVVGAVLLPWLAAVGAVSAVVTSCTIRVERRGDDEQGDETE